MMDVKKLQNVLPAYTYEHCLAAPMRRCVRTALYYMHIHANIILPLQCVAVFERYRNR